MIHTNISFLTGRPPISTKPSLAPPYSWRLGLMLPMEFFIVSVLVAVACSFVTVTAFMVTGFAGHLRPTSALTGMQ